ncbi:cytoplasmic protein [Oceanobacillus sp. FSL H7-0719]|uniref:cytoplasmic protein n=1 Tax=Oceanobacillus sp. FSL H7-0719 TaxID=2954507 RepID=UPI00324BAF59
MGNKLVYRRKFYIVKNDFVDVFNNHFNESNLPNQLKHGARLIGRWMIPNSEDTTERFAIWEYDSYEDYVKIESNVRSDEAHVKRVQEWYLQYGGRDHVINNYLLKVRNEELKTAVNQ